MLARIRLLGLEIFPERNRERRADPIQVQMKSSPNQGHSASLPESPRLHPQPCD